MKEEGEKWQDEMFVHSSYWGLVRDVLRTKLVWYDIGKFGLAWAILSVGGFSIDHMISLGNWAGGAQAVTLVRIWAANGVAFGSAMLAFLIAGFTIFATVTDVRVFKELATLRQSGKDIRRPKSLLQVIFTGFMIDFLYFVGFLGFCLGIGYLFAEKAPATALVGWGVRNYPVARGVIVHAAVGLLGAYMFGLVVVTKSFIWNVYQSILIAIALKDELK